MMIGDPNDTSRDQYIRDSLDRLLRTWLPRILVVGGILFLLLSFLDYVVTPENYWRFLAYRVATALVLFSCIPLSKKFHGEVQIKALGYLSIIVSAVSIELMVLQLGGHASIYYPGLILLGICVFSFLPAPLPYHLLNAGSIYLVYLVPILLFDTVTNGREFFTANFFMIAIFGTGLVLRYFSHRSLVHELSLQFDLKQHTEHLNELIDEKTAKLNKAISHLTAEAWERQRMQDELKKISDDWSETFDIISDAITIHDRDFTITRFNKAAKALLGLPELTTSPRKCFECYHGVPCPTEGCPGCRTLQTGISSSVQIYEPHLKKYLEIKAIPRVDVRGDVTGLIHVVHDITEQKKAEQEIHDAFEITRGILQKAPWGIYTVSSEGIVDYANPAMLAISGDLPEQFIGVNVFELPSYKTAGLDVKIRAAITGHPFTLGPVEYISYYGKKHSTRNFSGIPLDINGNKSALIFVEDITAEKMAEDEQKRLQTQLLQIQKMDSIGRLAGGIAHDFNNILSAIIGYSEIALNRLPKDSPSLDHIRIIRDSGYRAAELTKQLLAFSRKQVLELKPVNLNSVVENVSRMLTRMIGEDITLALQVNQPVHNVLADPGQIEQILLNLSVNARDAMPLGGLLTIKTADSVIEENDLLERPGISPGSYVMIEVTDTGIGMPREIHEKVFEPFFTTKEKGKGTGLGLATVYGIIKQHNGYIYLKSEPGKGTAFQIYLPTTTEEIADVHSRAFLPLARGTETLFVAEDEPSIRSLIIDTLKPLGYTIFSAADGEASLRFIKEYKDRIDLLLTDVIMPGMNGKELADTIKVLRPDIRVLFMTGYADETILRHGILDSGNALIQKPLSPEKLASRIREILDAEPTKPF